MRQQKVWVLVLLMIGLAACGTDSGPTPPDNPPSGGVEIDPAFSVNLSNLKPDIVDDYVDGTASYTEQGGVHFISGTATRNEGFSNESTVQLSLRIRGELQREPTSMALKLRTGTTLKLRSPLLTTASPLTMRQSLKARLQSVKLLRSALRVASCSPLMICATPRCPPLGTSQPLQRRLRLRSRHDFERRTLHAAHVIAFRYALPTRVRAWSCKCEWNGYKRRDG